MMIVMIMIGNDDMGDDGSDDNDDNVDDYFYNFDTSNINHS
jgi:hypothetical protein